MRTFDEHEPALRSAERAPEPAHPGSETATQLQRVLQLQRSLGNTAVQRLVDDDPHGITSVTSSGGSPLDTATRVQMEASLGADFADVRVHTGGEADRSARSLGANAYTTGTDIVFAEGRYDPSSIDGQRTLAHELTHVVQQRSGPVDGETTETGVKVSDPSDRFERTAVETADRVVAGLPAPGPVGGSGGSGVQRQGADEEEVQSERAQREVAQRESAEPDEAIEDEP
jgi:hypothetical protein